MNKTTDYVEVLLPEVYTRTPAWRFDILTETTPGSGVYKPLIGGQDTWFFRDAGQGVITAAYTEPTADQTGECEIHGDLNHDGTKLGFYGTAPVVKPTVTGARGGNAALASLLTQLASQGLITDGTTA